MQAVGNVLPVGIPNRDDQHVLGKNIDECIRPYFRNLEEHETFLERWKVDLELQLGSGSVGDVVVAGNFYAAKIMPFHPNPGYKAMIFSQFAKEITVNLFLADLRPPNFIMPMIASSWSIGHEVAIIYPRYECDLYAYLINHEDPVAAIWDMNPQALTILHYLEEHHLVHRDFRSQNLFVQNGKLILGDNATLCESPALAFPNLSLQLLPPEAICHLELHPNSDLWCWTKEVFQMATQKSFFLANVKPSFLDRSVKERLVMAQNETRAGNICPPYMEENPPFYPGWRSDSEKLGLPNLSCQQSLQKYADACFQDGDGKHGSLFLKIKEFVQKVLIIDPKARPSSREALSIHASLQELPEENHGSYCRNQ